MNFILILIAAAVIYFIYKKVKSSGLQSSDDHFSQHGVVVNYSAGTITINNSSYPVNQVMGIKTISGGSLGTVKGVEISVDDIKKPIHKIVIGGFGNAQELFAQRLSTALRKAGGPSFS